MNTKMLLKTILLILVLLLLVIMGMNNPQTVDFKLPPLLSKAQRLPAALMYFGFFAAGLLCGTAFSAGKKSGSGSGGSKSKSAK